MTSDGLTGEAAAAREMRILGDILALTLDEQPGVSDTALANIKARAREAGVTGGALKDAWRRLQAVTPSPGIFAQPSGRPGSASDGAAANLARTRMEIAELQSQAAHSEHLRRQDLRHHRLALQQARLLAAVAGALAGAAVMALLAALLRPG